MMGNNNRTQKSQNISQNQRVQQVQSTNEQIYNNNQQDLLSGLNMQVPQIQYQQKNEQQVFNQPQIQSQAQQPQKSAQQRKEVTWNHNNRLAKEVFFKNQAQFKDINLDDCEVESQEVKQKFQECFEQNFNLQSNINEAKLDENFNYQNAYLGKEGMFSDFVILIGQFYYMGENFQQGFRQTAENELKRIGFKVKIVYKEDEFASILDQFHIAWIVSNTQFTGNEQNFLKAVQKFMFDKKSLFIWADNTPYTYHANLILKDKFNGMYLEGNYYGGNIIYGDDVVQKSKFDINHAIAYGLNNIHEGITICHPVKMPEKAFKIFARNSNDEPLVLYADETDSHGRLIIDVGFTKLYPDFWKNAGTNQYVSNCAVWLTGIVL